MGVSNAEYECRKPDNNSTSSETTSCVNRASFAFITSFENVFFRFVKLKVPLFSLYGFQTGQLEVLRTIFTKSTSVVCVVASPIVTALELNNSSFQGYC